MSILLTYPNRQKLLYSDVRIKSPLLLAAFACTLQSSTELGTLCIELRFNPEGAPSRELTAAPLDPSDVLAYLPNLQHLEWSGNYLEEMLSILARCSGRISLKKLALYNYQLPEKTHGLLAALIANATFPNLKAIMLSELPKEKAASGQTTGPIAV